MTRHGDRHSVSVHPACARISGDHRGLRWASERGCDQVLALVEHLAGRFAQDALNSIPTPTEDLYQWLLVRPDDAIIRVSEIPSDGDEDGLSLRT